MQRGIRTTLIEQEYVANADRDKLPPLRWLIYKENLGATKSQRRVKVIAKGRQCGPWRKGG